MSCRESCVLPGVCATAFALAALASLWMGLSDLPCPRGVDDAFYKSPAAELVQTGRLAQPSVVGYLPRADEAFAAYPPLYQLAVAGWFGLFGVSTGASVAFGHVVHLLNMAAVMTLVATALAGLSLPTSLRGVAAAAAGMLFFGILRFFDRQEELAVFFVFVEMILHLRGRLQGWRGAAVSGLFVGASAMVSPWTGFVFAGLVTVRELLLAGRLADGGRAKAMVHAVGRLSAVGAVAAVPVAAWLGWLEWTHPRIVTEQFLVHLRVSERSTVFDSPAKALGSLLYTPYQLPGLLLTVALFPRLLKAGRRASVPAGVLALFGVGVASLVVAFFYRANSYNYVWLCLFLLIPCFGYLAGRLFAEAPPRERVFPVLLVLVCAAASLRDPVSLGLIARDLPDDERAGPIFARLAERVPPGAAVATTSRYWYLFQGRNPWRLTAIYPHLTAQQRREWATWIVLPPEHLSEEERDEMTRDFDLVERVPSTYATFAPSFHREDRTWAYELYRRRDEH
jgi:hypothetical protein